jgi:2'-5' RNA ligase
MSAPRGGIRSFVAVPLPPGAQLAIHAAAQRLAAAAPPGLRWSRKPDNLHVTVRFLGDVEEPRLAALAAALAVEVAALPGFPLTLRGFGAFPSARHANVVWAGVDDPRAGLARVAAAVEAVARRFGFAAEERPFRGHVTVGRAARRAPRGGTDLAAALGPFADHVFGEVTVGEVHIYESVLGGDGSTYILRGKAALEGATHGDV